MGGRFAGNASLVTEMARTDRYRPVSVADIVRAGREGEGGGADDGAKANGKSDHQSRDNMSFFNVQQRPTKAAQKHVVDPDKQPWVEK